MRELLVFAGTTEGRNLSEHLAQRGIRHTLCVATEYGEIVLKENPLVTVHRGRMDREEMRQFIRDGEFLGIVDATHPYAEAVTRNIKDAAEGTGIPCLRLRREDVPDGWKGQFSDAVCFDSNEACAKALADTAGNILLTTGSRELEQYCAFREIRDRLYVRVLPCIESLSLCKEHGICGKHIIAMQGPFTEQMNEAMLRQYEISCLVTKESGASGGFTEKLAAAARVGAKVFVIRRPREEGYSFSEICGELERLCGKEAQERTSFRMTLAGSGMGSADNLTQEVQREIKEADILLGAERMLYPYHPRIEKRPFYLAGEIIPYLREMQEKNPYAGNRNVVILFSGDSGFYSGSPKLYDALAAELREGRLRGTLRVLPGISSVAALAARLGESYQDAAIYSMHGKELKNLGGRIAGNPKTFLLMSGVRDVNRLGAVLQKEGLETCEVTAGYQLSYREEEILQLLPEECCQRNEEGLYVCMIKNPHARARRLTHGRADEEFMRDKTPMTKEEVREISICKLHLHRGAVVYDIGSGTGSIAVELAGLSDGVQVYAIEQKSGAVSLITQNKEKFGLENITVVEACAPDGMAALPAATHAFIGGSGGKLKEILTELYRINPKMRVVINAVSMETICEVRACLSFLEIQDEETVQVQVSRGRAIGKHHLLQAENPIWIFSFDFGGAK